MNKFKIVKHLRGKKVVGTWLLKILVDHLLFFAKVKRVFFCLAEVIINTALFLHSIRFHFSTSQLLYIQMI